MTVVLVTLTLSTLTCSMDMCVLLWMVMRE